MIVLCPTSMPGTSVIAFCGPTGRIPTTNPSALARGRFASWAINGPQQSKVTSVISFMPVIYFLLHVTVPGLVQNSRDLADASDRTGIASQLTEGFSGFASML